jgi:ABC-type nickel/cobalt efflux system permease component RcnA
MPPASSKGRGFALAWLLVAALLLAQLLGLMHGVVHGPQARLHSHGHHELASAHASNDHDHDHDHDHSATAHDEHGGWLASLFSSHDGDTDCRLFDQASQGHAAPVLPMLSLPLVLCTMAFDISRGEALVRWAALFDARGPPLTR